MLSLEDDGEDGHCVYCSRGVAKRPHSRPFHNQIAMEPWRVLGEGLSGCKQHLAIAFLCVKTGWSMHLTPKEQGSVSDREPQREEEKETRSSCNHLTLGCRGDWKERHPKQRNGTGEGGERKECGMP